MDIFKIVQALEEDISDRRGLKSEWAAIDDDVKDEIRETWAGIIHAAIEAQGWRVVPARPTEEMAIGGCMSFIEAGIPVGPKPVQDAYSAMLAAAPKVAP